jgi:hypothetical protein
MGRFEDTEAAVYTPDEITAVLEALAQDRILEFAAGSRFRLLKRLS